MNLRYKPKSTPIEPRALKIHEAKPEPRKVPDTEEWMRANPEKVIRLLAGQWSMPLLFDY